MSYFFPINKPTDGPFDWDMFGIIRPLFIDPSNIPHTGVDLRTTDRDRSVFATKAGKVVVSSPDFGSWLEIDHFDGTKSRYVHLIQRLKNVGNTVLQGERIGVYGVVGQSTGAHLHFEIWENNSRINPIDKLNENNQDNMFKDKLKEFIQKSSLDLKTKEENIEAVNGDDAEFLINSLVTQVKNNYSALNTNLQNANVEINGDDFGRLRSLIDNENWSQINKELPEVLAQKQSSFKSSITYFENEKNVLAGKLSEIEKAELQKAEEIKKAEKEKAELQKATQETLDLAKEKLQNLVPKSEVIVITDKAPEIKEKVSPLEIVKDAGRTGGIVASLITILGFSTEFWIQNQSFFVAKLPAGSIALITSCLSILTIVLKTILTSQKEKNRLKLEIENLKVEKS